jgi:O-antigen/teichoic acid export membrane protein
MSGANLAAQLVAYAALLVLARLIPPASFGTVAAGTALVWVAITVLDSGTRGGIIVTPRLTHDSLRRAFRRCLVAALALAAGMAVAAPLLIDATAEGGDAAVLAVLAASLPLYAVALIPMAVLERAMQFSKLARVAAISNAASATAAVVAGLVGFGVWALVTRQLLWFVLLAVLAVTLGRPYLPRRRSAASGSDAGPAPSVGDRWFLAFGATLLVAMNVDYLVVGGVSGVTALGLYALAFMIAFAPLQQFSGEIGRVLFAAAAASGLGASGPRTVHAVRLMAVLLLPLLPAALALAPVAVPAILGEEWEGMVAPLQVLLIVGMGQAIANCVGETLSGVGQIAFRAKVNAVWCVATVVALVVLVNIDGIRGAALAHLVVFVPYAAVYATAGARRAGTSPRELWGALRPTVIAVGWQSVATVVVAVGLEGAGADLAACAGAFAGLLVAAVLLGRDRHGPARQAAALLRPSGGAGR